MFEFKILAKDLKSKARVGEFVTPHGKLQTPELSIVATEGEVKCIPREMLDTLPIKYLCVNTFHIYTKNILEKIEKNNGIHTYANFSKTVVSDSGGFQVFSLGFGKAQRVGKLASMFPGKDAKNSDTDNPLRITDEGVTFTFNEKPVTLTPENSMDIQHRIGADMMFAFDECTSPLNSKKYNTLALKRTHEWLERCIQVHKKFEQKQALMAIVQGGYFEDLRTGAAKFIGKQDVPGFGIGGSLGKTKEDMYQVLEWTIPHLPDEKPRHLLGIGQVRDIFESVERGVDLFDCVIPTREARHKVLYTKHGKVKVNKMRTVNEVIDKDTPITYSQLAELFSLHDPRAFTFSTLHNIQFYTSLTSQIRDSISKGTFGELKDTYLKYYP